MRKHLHITIEASTLTVGSARIDQRLHKIVVTYLAGIS